MITFNDIPITALNISVLVSLLFVSRIILVKYTTTTELKEAFNNTKLSTGLPPTELKDNMYIVEFGNVTLKAGRRATLQAYNDSTLEAGEGSTLIAGDFSKLTAGNNSTLKAGDYAKMKSGYCSILTAGHYSTLVTSYLSEIRAKGNDIVVSRTDVPQVVTLQEGQIIKFLGCGIEGYTEKIDGKWYLHSEICK